MVWICDPNYHKILPTLALNFSRIIDHLRSHIKHSKVCFIRHPNTSKSFIKTQLRLVFSTYFSVFGYLMKHAFLCLIYYFLNFLTFQPSTKNIFGKNLKFYDFSMTQTNVSNFQDFSRRGMQISNSMTFHDHAGWEPCLRNYYRGIFDTF